jgi:hypothetical protein
MPHVTAHAFWAWGCCSPLPWEELQLSGRSSTSTPTRGRVPSNSPATAMSVISGPFSRAAMIPPKRRRPSRRLLHHQGEGSSAVPPVVPPLAPSAAPSLAMRAKGRPLGRLPGD